MYGCWGFVRPTLRKMREGWGTHRSLAGFRVGHPPTRPLQCQVAEMRPIADLGVSLGAPSFGLPYMSPNDSSEVDLEHERQISIV